MYMYCTEKVYMPENFRIKLSYIISTTRKEIVQDIQNRGDKYDVGNTPTVLPHIYVNLLYNPLLFQSLACFPGLSLPLNGSWFISKAILFNYIWSILTVGINCWWFLFQRSRQMKRGVDQHIPWHVYSNPKNQATYPVNAMKYLFLDPQKIIGHRKLFLC